MSAALAEITADVARLVATVCGGPFGAILADPPWAFRTYAGAEVTPHRAAGEDHYPVMGFDLLSRLGVEAYAADDCALFMWVIDSHLAEALRLGAAWGFAFKSIAFVWDKGSIGLGYWTRKEAEICLLFTRGKPRRLGKGVRQMIREPRREHSRKPDAQYDRIEALVDGPYLELFARTTRPGWRSWGLETGRFPTDA